MKKYICMTLALLMMATLFVGCGCTNQNVSNDPSGMITNPTSATNPIPTITTPPELPTRETTHPTTEATFPSTGMTIPGETDQDGGAMPTDVTGDTGTPTESTHSRGINRRKMP